MVAENVAKPLSPVKYSREPISAPPSSERSALRPSDYDFVPRGWIETYVRWACSRVPAPPIFHVACALGYAAFELGRRGWIVTNGHHKRPALWWAILAKSSTGKGLALKCLRDLDEAFTMQCAEAYKDDVLKDNDLGVYLPGVLDFTGTPEALFTELELRQYDDALGQKRSVLLGVHDEMREVFTRGSKHDSFMNDMHACFDQPARILRQQLNLKRKQDKFRGKTRTGLIPNPTASFVFTSTEDRLREVLKSEHIDGGFCSRFLWMSEPQDWVDPRNTDERWTDLNTEYLAIPRDVVMELERWVASLTFAATKRIRFSDDGSKAQSAATRRWLNLGSRVREITNRYQTHLLDLAVVIASVETPIDADIGTLEVMPEHVELAERLSRASLPVAQRLGGISDLILRIMQLVESQPGASRTDICRAISGLDPRRAREELTMLVEDEELITVRVAALGRPRYAYFLAGLQQELDLVGVDRIPEARLRELQARLRGDRLSLPPPAPTSDDTDTDADDDSGEGNTPPAMLN